ncbi:DUF7519 family protein [Halobacterium wangiae]|uniref:DUF7519 family protein n=1 Tax=Halobacterium wangiae TaxID=2902623 RepID=UPI001E47A2B6|nr:hypothetical protein [Halobacterium wangiae]
MTTSTTVRRPTLVAGLAVLAVVAYAVDDASFTYGNLAVVAAVGGAVLAVSTGLASREEPLAVFGASVLAPVGGVAVLAAMALSLSDLPLLDGLLDPFVLLALAAAGFGAVAAFTSGVGGGAVGRAFSVVVATTALPGLAAVGAIFLELDAQTGFIAGLAGGIADIAVTPTGRPIDVVVFFVLLAVTARALAAAADAAPLVELAPRHRRDAVARTTRWLVVVCLSIWRLFAVAWVAAFVALVTGAGQSMVAQVPSTIVSVVGTLASAEPLRPLMFATIAVSLLSYAGLRLARLATGDHRESLRRVAPTVGGGVLAVAVGVVYAAQLVDAARESTPEQALPLLENAVRVFGEPALALAALVLPLVGLAGLLLAFAALGRLRAVPQRGTPAAVAAAGLVLAGAVAGVQNASPGFVFGLVAAGMVAWDTGEYGVGLAAELDRRAPTARVELVHVAASVVVGVLAYHGANALYGATAGSSVPTTPAALAALVAAGVGLAALVAALAD